MGLALRSLVELSPINLTSPRILDPGAGRGVWGVAARQLYPGALITGVELQDRAKPPEYNHWVVADFLNNYPDPYPQYDLIIGNPPYKFAESFIQKCLTLLAPRGEMIFLLRIGFLEGQKRLKSLWEPYPPSKVLVSSRRPSFTENGRTDGTGYALYLWERGHKGGTALKWLNWQYMDNDYIQ
jgi:hypothetical protein